MCNERDNKNRKPTLIWICPHCSFERLHNRQSAQYATRPCGTMYKITLVSRTIKKDKKAVRDVILLMFIDAPYFIRMYDGKSIANNKIIACMSSDTIKPNVCG